MNKRMMDEELKADSSLLDIFERLKTGEDEEGDIDVDFNLLKNILESQASSFGHLNGPASQMLAQFGIQLPQPPKLNSEIDFN